MLAGNWNGPTLLARVAANGGVALAMIDLASISCNVCGPASNERMFSQFFQLPCDRVDLGDR